MAEKKPNIHKTLLILLLVFIPPFWLLFTDEGSRVSDTALLWLLGEDEIKISLTDLDSGYSSDDIRTIYPENEWQCGSHASDFGDALCAARIGTFNGFPARAVTFYFQGDRLSAMKLQYRELYHKQVMGHVIEKLGQPSNVAEALTDGPDAADILEWPLRSSMLVMKKSLQGGDEAALLWFAGSPQG